MCTRGLAGQPTVWTDIAYTSSAQKRHSRGRLPTGPSACARPFLKPACMSVTMCVCARALVCVRVGRAPAHGLESAPFARRIDGATGVQMSEGRDQALRCVLRNCLLPWDPSRMRITRNTAIGIHAFAWIDAAVDWTSHVWTASTAQGHRDKMCGQKMSQQRWRCRTS